MKLIIVDRDGVINRESDAYIKNPDEWVPLPGSLAALSQLTQTGWTVVVATNQAAVGRGLITLEVLETIHEKMRTAVIAAGGRLDAIFFCPHHPNDGCSCRKPKPGLLHQIADFYGVDLKAVPFVGDTQGDILAARSVGARPLLVLTGRGVATLAEMGNTDELEVYANLAAVAKKLIGEMN